MDKKQLSQRLQAVLDEIDNIDADLQGNFDESTLDRGCNPSAFKATISMQLDQAADYVSRAVNDYFLH